MKKILFSAAIALFSATQAFAILGVGAHFVYNTGSLKASSGEVASLNDPSFGTQAINFEQQKVNGLMGIGFKAWIDIIPVIDLEATVNFTGARYASVLQVPTVEGTELAQKEIPLEVDLGIPFFPKASPVFSAMTGDLSVTYPFDFLPIIRPYIGGGFTYFITTPIMNQKFVKKFLQDNQGLLENLEEMDPAVVGKALAKTLEDQRFTFGAGGHAIVGIRIKPPVIPLAIYANGKYYFGGNLDSQFENGFVLEAGGGLAF